MKLDRSSLLCGALLILSAIALASLTQRDETENASIKTDQIDFQVSDTTECFATATTNRQSAVTTGLRSEKETAISFYECKPLGTQNYPGLGTTLVASWDASHSRVSLAAFPESEIRVLPEGCDKSLTYLDCDSLEAQTKGGSAVVLRPGGTALSLPFVPARSHFDGQSLVVEVDIELLERAYGKR